ncbi:MAG: hypothetical protein ACO3UU_08315 [Minisyncoccia bacterium]
MLWNLEKLYETKVRGNIIPVHDRLRVLGEDITLYSQDKDGDFEEIGTVQNDQYEKIKKFIYHSGGEDILDLLIKKSGFNSQHRWIKQFFAEFNVNYRELEKIVSNKENLNLLTSELRGVEGSLSIKNIVSPVIERILTRETPQVKDNFYNILFAHTFADGQVGVGKGELLLSLLTECSKGAVGDLQTPNGVTIELKVGMGRVVSARSRGFTAMRDIITSLSLKKDLSAEDILSVKNSPYNSFSNKQSVERLMEVMPQDPKERLQYFGGLMLDGYSAHGKGFNYIIFILQKGLPRKQGVFKAEGTYDIGNYLKLDTFDSIINSIKNKQVVFAYDTEGVYISYPGSNTKAGFDKDFKL